MFFTELIQGFIIGLAVAAPVGPIGVLCIKRTLTQGWLVAIFAGIGLSKSTHTTYILVLGVFLGSASWWLFLSTIINIFKDRLHNEVLTHINRISGGIILLFGILAIYGYIMHL